MIITKTPLRVSFVGGGTDLPNYYKKHGGMVISTSINKFIYVIVRRQVGFLDYKFRINWSEVEFKNAIGKINNPIVREVLKYFNINFPIEISTFSDIPGSTGLGSSSSFAVGLINAISVLIKKKLSKKKIAKIAASIEIDILKRKIGVQDHYSAAVGGLNLLNFKKNNSVVITKIKNQSFKKIKKLERELVLVFTKQTRNASDILSKQYKPTNSQTKDLSLMKNEVITFKNFFLSQSLDAKLFGKMLTNQWKLKKKVNSNVTNSKISKIFDKCIKLGSYGGKLLGAGNGGFFLIVSNSKTRKKIEKFIGKENLINFSFEKLGTHVTHIS
jgi:D-glycero-alpha-D-manno-heptose-7-phosphate kinase